MTTVREQLDTVQRVLQDTATLGLDGTIWSRAELLAYFEDGYRQMLAATSARRQFTVLDVPPRFPWAVTHLWQLPFVADAPAFPWAYQGEGGFAASSLWGVEQVEGITPTKSGIGLTQPWQRFLGNPDQQHFQFAVPRDTERVIKIWYNHRLLLPIATRALDRTESLWMSLDGEPIAWTLGTGQNRTVEIYQVVTGYMANYVQRDMVTNDANPLYGTAKRFMPGSRTYSWVSDSGDSIPYGIPRRVSSPDRQYYPHVREPLSAPLGRAAWLASSVSALLLLVAQVPSVPLLEDDTSGLLPPQLGKYLRYYTLFRAFNRQGEGYNPTMALLFQQRYQRGVLFLQQLHQITRKDRQVVRGTVTTAQRRPPRVRLPSNYPRVLPW